MIEDRNVYLARDFWAAFRSRFLPVTVVGLIFCCCTALAVLAITAYAGAATDNLLFAAPLAIAIVVAVLLPLFAIHLFVALAQGSDRSLADSAKASAIGLVARPLPGFAALMAVALLWLIHVHFLPWIAPPAGAGRFLARRAVDQLRRAQGRSVRFLAYRNRAPTGANKKTEDAVGVTILNDGGKT